MFLKAAEGLSIGTGPLYSFIHAPVLLHNNFLGLVDLQSKSIVLALLTGVSQFVQGYLATPITSKPKVEVVTSKQADSAPTFQDQLSDSMQTNVKYILPIFITFFAYKISAAIALYWMISNIFTIIQEWYIRRTVHVKENI